jgi:hypothetical protein
MLLPQIKKKILLNDEKNVEEKDKRKAGQKVFELLNLFPFRLLRTQVLCFGLRRGNFMSAALVEVFESS